jgi:Arc/MetJ family transcription regulator
MTMSRTTVDLNDDLIRQAMTKAHVKTKREAIERGLQELINAERRRALIALQGNGYGMTLQEFLRSREDE